jgi:hypothetical protein
LTISDSIKLSGNSIIGSVHVNGSSCFDPLTSIPLTGTLTGSEAILTSTSAGEVSSVNGMADRTINGTYTIKDGCADGDHGTVAGRYSTAYRQHF